MAIFLIKKSSVMDPDPNPDLDPNPDPLVRGMDPRIRIHTKMSWIRNTEKKIKNSHELMARDPYPDQDSVNPDPQYCF
jgi:hypothetical protein